MNSFEIDMAFSKKTEFFIDKVYNKLFKMKKVTRTSTNHSNTREDNLLDQKYHIDCTIELALGTKLTFQEKVLRHKFSTFDTLTIEFLQNRHTDERGEFFNLCSQFYFHGYANEAEDGLEKWYIINVGKFMIWLQHEDYKMLKGMRTRPLDSGSGNASLYYVGYDFIPKDIIEYSYLD